MISNKDVREDVQEIMNLGIDCGLYIKLASILNSLDTEKVDPDKRRMILASLRTVANLFRLINGRKPNVPNSESY